MLPIGIASLVFWRTNVATVLITQPGATLDERAQNEHYCRLGLQPRAPASHYGPEFLPRFAQESNGPTLESNLPRDSGCDSSRTMSRGAITVAPYADSRCRPTGRRRPALLKYGTGVPFKRLERLQEHLGMPLPATTQWDLMAAAWKLLWPVLVELIRQAA